MKKILSVVLTILLMLSVLAVFDGCGETEGNEDETTAGDNITEKTTTEEGGEVTTEPAETEVKIAEGSNIYFSLVRPDEVTTEFFALYQQIAVAIDTKTGGMTECTTDFLMPGTSHDDAKLEILFGNCNYPEIDTVTASLGLDDYAIRMIGNKIVILAHNKDTLAAAVEAFLENVMKTEQNENGETVLLYGGDYTYTSDKKSFFKEGNPLSAYTVVYPEGNELMSTLANRLATRIERQIGVTLPVVSDATTATAYELAIGNTNRTPAGNMFDGVKEHQVMIRAFEDKLYIGGTSDFGIENGVDDIIKNLTYSPYSDFFNFYEDHNEVFSGYDSDNSASLYKDTDLRIMSWNMLTELWNDKIPVEDRDEYAAATISYYLPDVIGMQEITETWYNTLENLLGDTYAFVSRVNQNGSISYNGIFYNKNTVRLVKNGVTNYSVGAGTMRLYTWALFERISDGKQFIVSSTHWDTGSYPDRIAIQAKEMADLVTGLYNEYNVPIFNTGDYNSPEDNSSFFGFLLDTFFQDSRRVAKKIGSEGKTYDSPPLGDIPGSGGAIDHIVVSPDVTVSYYTRVADPLSVHTSDHCPIFIDVKIGD